MRRKLSRQEILRANRVALTGVFLALAMSVIFTSLVLMSSPFNSFSLVFTLSAASATFISVKLFWSRLLRKGETRGRGALYGALAGLFAVILMCIIASLYAGISYALFDKSFDGIHFTFALEYLYYTLGLLYYALLFGGFFAIPFGALAGYMLSKNPGPH